ncbi:MAG: flagellin [Candidatus Puniceispirillales bacterium]
MTSINSDFMSQLALRSLGNSSNMMTQAMERLSTGKRVNSAADDAAGLGIATKLKAQVNSLNAASRNATDALALIGTIDGALEESSEILLRMRELAVQSASDTNTGTDRSFIQDEINQLNNELNRISSSTEFNSVKLLDGTYNNKQIQIGTSANQVFNIGVTSTDAATLGAYQMESLAEHNTAAAADAAAAVTLSDALINVAANYTVKGSFGSTTVNVAAGDDAKTVAQSFNLAAGTTGITAAAITKAQITAVSNETYSFTLKGKSSTASTVNATVTSATNLTALKDAINSVSGATGITAALTEDLSGVNLVQQDGFDIIVGDVTSSGSGTMSLAAANKNGVVSQSTVALGGTTTLDSQVIIGQISLSSHKAFTVTSGNAANHFHTTTDAKTSSLETMGAVDISSQTGATNALSVIDGAIAMVSEIRSEMGAAENRLTSTVDNLSNVSVNTQRSLTAVEDANFASETSALTKAQILQQAATSMLAQANKAKQTMLVLLQG